MLVIGLVSIPGAFLLIYFTHFGSFDLWFTMLNKKSHKFFKKVITSLYMKKNI